jgi:hypothetical protein
LPRLSASLQAGLLALFPLLELPYLLIGVVPDLTEDRGGADRVDRGQEDAVLDVAQMAVEKADVRRDHAQGAELLCGVLPPCLEPDTPSGRGPVLDLDQVELVGFLQDAELLAVRRSVPVDDLVDDGLSGCALLVVPARDEDQLVAFGQQSLLLRQPLPPDQVVGG